MFKGLIYFFKTCWKFDKIYVINLFILQIIDALNTFLMLIIPKYIIEYLFVQKNTILAIKLIILQICIFFIYHIMVGFITTRNLLRRMKIFKNFQIYLGDMSMKADYENVENPKYLEIRSNAYKFLYSDGRGFAQTLEEGFSIIGNVLSLFSIIVILFTLNIFLVLLLIVCIIFSTYIDAKMEYKVINLNFKKTKNERRSSYFSSIFSDFRYGKEIRANGIQKWLINKYDEQLLEMQEVYKEIATCRNNNNIFNTLINSIQQIILYAYIVYQVILNKITVSNFTLYLNSVIKFTSILKTIINQIVSLRQCTHYYKYYEEYVNLSKNNNVDNNISILGNKENLVFKFENVSFKYNGSNKYALKNLNLEIDDKTKLAIVGENGSGKSTFIKLLLRIYKPTEGTIYLNGIDINSIDYNEYIKLFSTVFQDFKLFSMSIEDNLQLDANDEEIQDKKIKLDEYLKSCNLYDKFNNFDNKLKTYIYKDFEETGFEPSGGEGQRIAIIRALYKNAPIIILDEPTSALDPKTENEIYKQFDLFYKNKMVMFISHRYAVAKFCDRILFFKDGEIIEDGSHLQLMENKKCYYETYKIQKDYYV